MNPAKVNQHALENIRLSAQVHTPHASRFIGVGEASFQKLSPIPQQLFPVLAVNAPPVVIHRLPRLRLILPATASTVRFRNIAPNLGLLQRRQRVDPEQEYFAEGLTEALITTLAKIGELRVVSRTSAMQYKGVHKSLREIARELGVDAVVEGTVLRAGGRIRITAQLIDAAKETHLWAESYERDMRDILTLQSEVAQAIAGEIRVKLTPQELAHFALVHA